VEAVVAQAAFIRAGPQGTLMIQRVLMIPAVKRQSALYLKIAMAMVKLTSRATVMKPVQLVMLVTLAIFIPLTAKTMIVMEK
jgi:hypothetical protein